MSESHYCHSLKVQNFPVKLNLLFSLFLSYTKKDILWSLPYVV